MDQILLDTNVVSFLLKEDTRAKTYAPYLEGRILMLSFMTVAELFQWAIIRNWGAQRMEQLELTLQAYTVLPFDLALCRKWGEVRAKCRAAGHPISPQDAWIAATALQYNLSLITHDWADFAIVEGLQLISAAT